MYQALYRKYRPRTFSDVAGQEHVTVTLKRQIMSGRQSHAYLFVGTRGTGKTTCAKILSRALNCQSPVEGDPCNKCASCVGIENGSILDVLELDAASNNGVDDVRALREEAIYTPASVGKRVYIIDEAHMLTNSAFNALLKILEEPPEHLVFILATTALHKVPATILSRCQRFSFKRISPAAISKRLDYVAENEGLTLTEDASNTLAALADGSMRDALSLLDQCASDTVVDLQRVLDTIGLVGHQEILSLLNAVATRDVAKALGIIDNLYDDGRDMASILSEMSMLIRDVLVFKLSPDSSLQSGSFNREELSALSANLQPERLFSLLEVVREAVFGLSRGGGARLTVDTALIRMCDERLSDDMPAVLARIARLESETRIPGSATTREIDPGTVPSQSVSPSLDIEHDDIADPVSNSQFAIHNSQQNHWASILDSLRGDMSIYSVLSDSERVQADQRDSTLIIRAGDSFTVGLIESDRFSNPLTAAVKKVLGEDAIVRIEVRGNSAQESKRSKIDELAKFGIAKFE